MAKKLIKLTIFDINEYKKFKALAWAGGATHTVKVTEDVVGYWIIYLKPRNILERITSRRLISKSEFTFAS